MQNRHLSISTEMNEATFYQALSADYARSAMSFNLNPPERVKYQRAAAYAAEVARVHLFYMLDALQTFRADNR